MPMAVGAAEVAGSDPDSRAGKTRSFYQASTSELYGNGSGDSADGNDAVLSAVAVWRWRSCMRYWITVNYREAYGMLCLQWDSVQS